MHVCHYVAGDFISNALCQDRHNGKPGFHRHGIRRTQTGGSVSMRSAKIANLSRVTTVAILSLLLVLAAGCSRTEKTNRKAPLKTNLILATTTSTQDTGLLDELAPKFEKQYPYQVKTIAVGSGEALAMGQRGEADVLLAHSPQSEEEFMAGGYGSSRQPVMHNWFLLVGPKNDPAGAANAGSVSESLKAISEKRALFISRGDESGTHKKELKIWEAAGIKPAGAWYLQSGQGMGETLRIADQKNAYTLSDEGTFLAVGSSVSLKVIKSKEKDLKNPYSVIRVNAKRFPKVNEKGARDFSKFITGPAGQTLIKTFGKEKYGKPLFTPDAR